MKIKSIRLFLTVLFFSLSVVPGMAAEGSAAAPSSVTPQVQDLQEKMLNDQGIMDLIKALQDDPEMRALLTDPQVQEAVQAGDVGTLLAYPRFMQILNNPRVKEIEKRLENQEGGGAK
jgi:hypothetical protein